MTCSRGQKVQEDNRCEQYPICIVGKIFNESRGKNICNRVRTFRLMIDSDFVGFVGGGFVRYLLIVFVRVVTGDGHVGGTGTRGI